MPHIGSQIVDVRAVDLIQRWIRQLPIRTVEMALIQKLREKNDSVRKQAIQDLLRGTSSAMVLSRAVRWIGTTQVRRATKSLPPPCNRASRRFATCSSDLFPMHCEPNDWAASSIPMTSWHEPEISTAGTTVFQYRRHRLQDLSHDRRRWRQSRTRSHPNRLAPQSRTDPREPAGTVQIDRSEILDIPDRDETGTDCERRDDRAECGIGDDSRCARSRNQIQRIGDRPDWRHNLNRSCPTSCSAT